MKPKEKFYPTNNQEDEDVYNVHEADSRKKQRLNSGDHFESTRPVPVKLQTRRLLLSSFQQIRER